MTRDQQHHDVDKEHRRHPQPRQSQTQCAAFIAVLALTPPRSFYQHRSTEHDAADQ